MQWDGVVGNGAWATRWASTSKHKSKRKCTTVVLGYKEKICITKERERSVPEMSVGILWAENNTVESQVCTRNEAFDLPDCEILPNRSSEPHTCVPLLSSMSSMSTAVFLQVSPYSQFTGSVCRVLKFLSVFVNLLRLRFLNVSSVKWRITNRCVLQRQS